VSVLAEQWEHIGSTAEKKKGQNEASEETHTVRRRYSDVDDRAWRLRSREIEAN
jgi:hypothetical protein